MSDLTVRAQQLFGLVGRALVGVYFIVPGISKITGYAGTLQYMQAHAVPVAQVLLPLTIVLQIGCGGAIVAGYRVQLCAFVLAGLTLIISIYMHDFWSLGEGVARSHEMQNFIKNMAIMAGLMVMAGGNHLQTG